MHLRGKLARHVCKALVSRFVQAYQLLTLTSLFVFRDKLVAKGKASELSAAVVFMPQHTLHYGKHGSDKCFCNEMYGKVCITRA